jgi:hypothetical protein
MRARALVIGAVLAGTLTACAGSSNDAGTTGATPATGPSAATGATGGSAATGSTTGASGSTGTTGSIPPTDLADGRYFGYIRVLHPDGVIRFDLAYFLTGEDANQAAAEHGDETPPPNDYYIVNDNPRLRTLALAPEAEIEVFDWNHCCDAPVRVDVATFRQALAAGADGVTVNGQLIRGGSQYWLTLEGGVVTKIEEQFLP